MEGQNVMLTIPLTELYPTFILENAVCNHGFFMMAPNNWNPENKTLQRPLRLSDSMTNVLVSISSSSHPDGTTSLLIQVHDTHHLSSVDEDAILGQVRRMLRITWKDECDVVAFYKLHPEAKESAFGRIFRSPTLFEDVVKSLLLTNCGFDRTLEMARALCDHQVELANKVKNKAGKTKKRKKNWGARKRSYKTTGNHKEPKTVQNFPNAIEVANVDAKYLKEQCRSLGYRATSIFNFASLFYNDKLKFIKSIENQQSVMSLGLFSELMSLKGFGPFVSSNVLMCCGFYEKIPQDSETKRHLLDNHRRTDCDTKNIIKEIYGKYAPFQCLAYWWELWKWYEEKFGRLSEMPSSRYHTVTGSKVLHEPSLRMKG